MKRNDSLPFLFIVPLVIGASFAAGYFFLGGHQAPPPAPAPIPAPVAVDTTPKPAPVRRRQIASAGQYVAPGSPKVSISEVKGATPVKRETPVVDSESSETGVAPPAPPVVPSDAPPPSPDATTPSAPPDGSTPAATAPDATTPSTATPASDSGTAPTAAAATGTDAPDPNAPLYRVNAGTFQDEKNAKNFADALRRRGYTAIAQPSGDAGSTSYRVQVGVYRNRSAADQAATDLQRSGYPAFVSAK